MINKLNIVVFSSHLASTRVGGHRYKYAIQLSSHPKDRSRRPGLSFGVSGGRKSKNETRPKVTRNRPKRCPKGDSTLEIVVGRSAAAVP